MITAVSTQFPIDIIKIDRSFVRDLARDSEDQAITRAIINMAKALGMTVVAEGVKNTEQQAFLRRHACDEMQGFLFSKPVPAIEVPEFLRPSRACSPSLQPGDDDERHSDYSARKVARAGADAAL